MTGGTAGAPTGGATPPDPFPTDCPGCRDGSEAHVGHGYIVEGDDRLRLAD